MQGAQHNDASSHHQPDWRQHRDCLDRVLNDLSQHQMQRTFFLDVVVGQRSSVFQFVACKDQALLIKRDTSVPSSA